MHLWPHLIVYVSHTFTINPRYPIYIFFTSRRRYRYHTLPRYIVGCLDSNLELHLNISLSWLFSFQNKPTKSQLQTALRDLLSARFISVMIDVVQFLSKRHHCGMMWRALCSIPIVALEAPCREQRHTRSENHLLSLAGCAVSVHHEGQIQDSGEAETSRHHGCHV